MPLTLLPFILLIIPIVEISVFIFVGKEIGVLWIIFLILFTAVLGMAILRIEGFLTFVQIRKKIDSGQMPGEELLKAAMILTAGVLLLTPGFITDIIGLTFLVPFVRKLAWRFLINRFAYKMANINASDHDDPAEKNADFANSNVVELDPEDFHENSDSRKS